MACMCGDTNCPSCGPAQGAYPAAERVAEWIQEVILADLPDIIDKTALADYLTKAFGSIDNGGVMNQWIDPKTGFVWTLTNRGGSIECEGHDCGDSICEPGKQLTTREVIDFCRCMDGDQSS